MRDGPRGLSKRCGSCYKFGGVTLEADEQNAPRP